MIEYRTNADEVAKALQDIQRDFPREFPRAFATLSRGLKSRIGDVVRTGHSAKLGVVLPFSPLNPITRKARRRSTFGGRLAKSITSFVSSKGLKIQWPFDLRKYGTAFQKADSRPYSDNEKRFLYAIAESANPGDRKKDRTARAAVESMVQVALEEGYQRPAREVWAPIANARGFRRYCLDVVQKRIAAIFEKRAKGKR